MARDPSHDPYRQALLVEACTTLVRELRRMAHAEGLYEPFAIYSDEIKIMWIHAARVIEDEVLNRMKH